MVKALAFLSCAVVIMLVGTASIFGQIFFVNRTASMPIGIYLKWLQDGLALGDIVVFKLDGRVGNLIKYVAAITGDEICQDHEGCFWVNEEIAACASKKYVTFSSVQSHCFVLSRNEIWALGEHPDSYDSRYFGAIKPEDRIAIVKPFWLFL